MQSDIEIDEIDDYIAVVTVSGHLDSELASQLNPQIRQLTKAKKLLVVDLQNLEFLASAGLGALLYAAKDLEKKNGQVWLVSLQPQVRKIFKLTRVESMFRFYDSMEEATQELPAG